jgi:Shedu protein SduA, C-terminal
MFSLPDKPTPGFKSLSDLPEDFPLKEFFAHSNFITDDQKKGIKKLIEAKSGEKEIDKYLSENKSLWDAFFPDTGNHGIWVIPKQQIKTKIGVGRGLIPDFFIRTKNSFGYQYWVVELKGANASLLTLNGAKELYFTSEANKGICQLLEYIDYCAKYQTKFRDEFKFEDFREPTGLLILGTEQEFNGDTLKRNFKAAWNRYNPKLLIRSYSSLLKL